MVNSIIGAGVFVIITNIMTNIMTKFARKNKKESLSKTKIDMLVNLIVFLIFIAFWTLVSFIKKDLNYGLWVVRSISYFIGIAIAIFSFELSKK